MLRLAPCLFLLSILTACSDDDGSADSGALDGAVDADVPMDATLDDMGEADMADAIDMGIPGCMDGEHMCPDGCTPDNANEPSMGCRLGCGEACPVPDGGEASCGSNGLCVAECVAPGVLDGERCCGGALTCSEGVDLLLACPESEEPNDEELAARVVGTFDDEETRVEGIANLALPVGDVDYFRFNVTDTCCSRDTQVRVGLETDSADALELAAWVRCDSGDDDHTCDGDADTTHGFGCTTETRAGTRSTLDFDLDCTGTLDENVSVLVRVRSVEPASMCTDYDLTWSTSL